MPRPSQQIYPSPTANPDHADIVVTQRVGTLGGRKVDLTPLDQPFGELALVCPTGDITHQLDWQSTQPVRLLHNVQRLTAPNPGVMTGPGTNSYLVGKRSTGYLVIDPGPNDAEHLDRLWQAAGGDIRQIICTHSHPDHSPGAAPLQALCHDKPPIVGLPSAPTARVSCTFTPDRILKNGEELVLSAVNDADRETHTLQVIYTPGHAANHLCLILLEDGLLFSGDHILNGSTTVIDPPDGEMTAYLESLDLLATACTTHEVGFILPAHGYVLGGSTGAALAVIANLKSHRLRREAKVARAMLALPQGTLDEWVALAYDDVPQRIWPVAKRSLMAHVARLQALAH